MAPDVCPLPTGLGSPALATDTRQATVGLRKTERRASAAAESRSDAGAEAVGSRLHAFVRHGLDVESHLEYLPMSSMPLPSPFPVAQSENDRGSCVRTVLLRHTLRQENLHEGLVGHVALVGQEFQILQQRCR